MNSNNGNLTPVDAYALARALIGLPLDPLPLSPVAGLLLAHLDPDVVERFLADGGERGRQPEAYRLTEQSVTACDT